MNDLNSQMEFSRKNSRSKSKGYDKYNKCQSKQSLIDPQNRYDNDHDPSINSTQDISYLTARTKNNTINRYGTPILSDTTLSKTADHKGDKSQLLSERDIAINNFMSTREIIFTGRDDANESNLEETPRIDNQSDNEHISQVKKGSFPIRDQPVRVSRRTDKSG